MPSKRFKKMIGRKELVDFPQLDLFDLSAKIDTGAYTSSIHCHNIQPFKENGTLKVRFNLLDPTHEAYNDKEFTLPVCTRKIVKNSFGDKERRYTIMTSIRLYQEDYPIELALTDRSKMEFPILLGRKLLIGRFLVDVARINLCKKMK